MLHIQSYFLVDLLTYKFLIRIHIIIGIHTFVLLPPPPYLVDIKLFCSGAWFITCNYCNKNKPPTHILNCVDGLSVYSLAIVFAIGAQYMVLLRPELIPFHY